MTSSAKRDRNGTWRIQYRYTDWTGKKRKSQKRGFKTKKEAEEWVAHFKYQQSSDPSMPLRDFWKIYMEDMGKRLKETTIENKEHIWRCKIEPYFGDLPINEITPSRMVLWKRLRNLSDRNLSRRNWKSGSKNLVIWRSKREI